MATTNSKTDTPAPAPKPVKRDPRRLVHVYDTTTNRKVPNGVPETWLDIFPHLKEQPSKKGNTTPKEGN